MSVLFLRTRPSALVLIAWMIIALGPRHLAALAADGSSLSRAEAVTAHYVTLAHERYDDSLQRAIALRDSVGAFVAAPSPETHAAAKAAWIAAHRAYSHTEVFRFGNPNVDAWEGKVNAWPLDEGLIDYVRDDYASVGGNPYANWNFIATNMPVDAELISEIQEGTDPKAGPQGLADFETNVAAGYHAIEFLLWGQDHNEPPDVAGRRPYTDYVQGPDCTHGNCDRRGLYLRSIASKLVADLRWMTTEWQYKNPRQYATRFRALPLGEQLRRMIDGMGNLSLGELAGERLRVALIAGDQEEEQSCFSDTTHFAVYGNALGIKTLYLGQHRRSDGRAVVGPSLAGLVATLDPALDSRLRTAFDESMSRAQAVVDAAVAGEPFDQMIRTENTAGRARIQALIDALRAQTAAIQAVKDRVPALAAL